MSSTTPTISMGLAGAEFCAICLPTGSSPGKYTRTKAWFMIATSGLLASSASLKARPRSNLAVICLGEGPAAQQLGAERREVGRADLAIRRLIVFAVPRTSGDAKRGRAAVAAQRNAQAREPHGTDARQRFGTPDHLAGQSDGLLVIVVTRHRGIDRDADQMLRLDSESHMEEPEEALAQQPRAHQQYHRRRQFEHHQFRSELSPNGAGRSARRLRQSIANTRRPDPQARRQGEQQHCAQGDSERQCDQTRDSTPVPAETASGSACVPRLNPAAGGSPNATKAFQERWPRHPEPPLR